MVTAQRLSPVTQRAMRRLSGAFDPYLLALLLIAAFLFLLPMLAVVFGAFRTNPPGSPGTFTTHPVTQAIADHSNWTTLANSLGLAVAQSVISTTIGVFFAFVVARTNTPGRRLVTPMMVLILAVSPLFFALGWAMLGEPRGGGLNKLGELLFHGMWHSVNVFSWPGIIGVAAMQSAAVAYLLLIGPFLAVDRSLEEAAQIAGAGRFRTALTMETGLLAPNILAVATLGFLIGLQGFEIPLILGVPAGIRVFGTQIYFFAQEIQPPRFGEASVLSLLVIAVVLALVQARSRALRHRSFATVTGRSYRRDRWHIGRWRWACTGAIAVFGLLGLIAPLAQLAVGSFQSFFGLYRNYTLLNYKDLFADPSVIHALITTAVIMTIGGGLATCLAVLIGHKALRSRRRLGAFLNWMTWLPFAVPGVVLGLGMSWAWLSIPPLRPLFGTIWINLLGLMVLGVPIVSRSTEGALMQLSAELEEAARIAGGSARRVFARIVVPLILPSALAGWAIAAIVMAGNLAVPILLSSLSNQPVAVSIYNMYQSGNGAEAAALLCLMLVMLSVVMALAALALFVRRWAGPIAAKAAEGGAGVRLRQRSLSEELIAHSRRSRPAAVEMRGVTKRYGETLAVDGLDLNIEPGEFVTLLGPSGCGKTTTLRCIVGLEAPDGGAVTIGGVVMSDSQSGAFIPPERRETGMVFQSFALWPHMKVASNISYPMRIRGWPRADCSRRVDELLALVGLPGHARSQVGNLSGGQQQRVAVARALASNPALLVFDEPLSNLDAKMRATMRSELRRIHQAAGATSVYVTHDQTEAVALSDRVIVMKAGRIRQVGTPREIFSRPVDAYVADFVGFDNVIRGRVVACNGKAATVEIPGGLRLTGVPSAATGPRPGQAADVAFRAGAAVLPQVLHSENRIRGPLRDSTYLGDQVELKLDVCGVPVKLTVSDNEHDAIRRTNAGQDGREIEASIPVESVVILPALDGISAEQDIALTRELEGR